MPGPAAAGAVYGSEGTASFDSVDALVATEVEGSPLFERIDDATYDAIREDCRAALARFATPTGPDPGAAGLPLGPR